MKEINSFRISKKLREDIEVIVKDSPEKFESVSHFVRCAVIKLIKENRGVRNVE